MLPPASSWRQPVSLAPGESSWIKTLRQCALDICSSFQFHRRAISSRGSSAGREPGCASPAQGRKDRRDQMPPACAVRGAGSPPFSCRIRALAQEKLALLKSNGLPNHRLHGDGGALVQLVPLRSLHRRYQVVRQANGDLASVIAPADVTGVQIVIAPCRNQAGVLQPAEMDESRIVLPDTVSSCGYS